MKSVLLHTVRAIRFVIGAAVLFVIGVNAYMKVAALPLMYVSAQDVPARQTILVLGTRVYGGSVSELLAERLDSAVSLYRQKKAEKFLVSGDHGSKYYDEVNTMRRYLLKQGIAPEDIFMDHAGFSTYDSLYRAHSIFHAQSIIIVTQQFHLPRALFIARAFNIDAVGLRAGDGSLTRSIALRNAIREPLARVKAWWDVAIHAPPVVLGKEIPITGDGRQTGG